MKDDNYLIKVEKAIEDKYGEETIQNPRSNWSPQKEKEYLRQIKEAYKLQKPREKVEVNGVLMPKKLFNKESERTCPVCEVYTRYSQDDLYLTKFKCCYRCYIQHVEGREEKWLNSLKKNLKK